MPAELRPELSIVPIVRASKTVPIAELLGTGFFVGQANSIRLVTAKHVFESCQLAADEKYAIAFRGETGIPVIAISRVLASPDFDLAVADVPLEHIPTVMPLTLGKSDPALNADVFTFEYSGTQIEKPTPGQTHIAFEPYTHKGNIVRSYDSTYPEKIKTPTFLVSFPALQGASGAPLLSGTPSKKSIAVVGMTVANVERHLIPAQIVQIQEGKDFSEKISYYLPFGKALARAAVTEALQSMGVQFSYAEDLE